MSPKRHTRSRTAAIKARSLSVKIAASAPKKTSKNVSKKPKSPSKSTAKPVEKITAAAPATSHRSLKSITKEKTEKTRAESPKKTLTIAATPKSPQGKVDIDLKRSPKPTSPRTLRSNTPSSLRFHFMAKEIVANALKENRAPPAAVVLERSHYRPAGEHRQRQPWTPAELNRLRRGIEKYGEGAWAQIWSDATLGFLNGRRTQVDLKDKWRNCTAYRAYSQNPIRRFILVDAQHQPILTPSGQFHVYNNRWPRDAAMKAATKDEMYPVHPITGLPVSETRIYLRELLASDSSPQNTSTDPPLSVVHVYHGARQREKSPAGVPKFANARQMWVARVEKVAEELYIVPQ